MNEDDVGSQSAINYAINTVSIEALATLYGRISAQEAALNPELEEKPIKLIVTHPGQAHRDDFVAVCLLLASSHGEASVVRRDPTQEELADPTVAVVDVGGHHAPALRNFDHHQFERGSTPTCAITLVLRHLDLEETARKAMRWLEYTEIMDCQGGKALGAHVIKQLDPDVLGVDHGYAERAWDVLQPMQSPVEAQMLRLFASPACSLAAGSMLSTLMHAMGKGWLDYLKAWKARRENLGNLAMIGSDAVIGKDCKLRPFTWIDVRSIPGDEEPTLALEDWIEDNHHGSAAIVVSNDNRGPGLSLFRRNDHPMFDFTKLDGNPLVKFAHKTGFVAKTKGRVSDKELRELLELAIK